MTQGRPSNEKSSSVKKQQREQEKEDSKRMLQRTESLLADIDEVLSGKSPTRESTNTDN